MRPTFVLLAAALTLAIAVAAPAAEEQPAGTGQTGAAEKSGMEKPPKGDGSMKEKSNAPAGGNAVNYEELFGCKPMEDMSGHGRVDRKPGG